MYNIVSGNRRSGTSLMMLALRTAGIPIIGFRYPIFTLNKGNEIILSTSPSKEMREGNPNGYWEMGNISCITGLKPEHYDIGLKGDLIKIVSDVIFYSDPKLINKTILMYRHPRAMLSSMIRGNIIKLHELEDAIEKIYITTERTLTYLKENKIPHIKIYYEEMLKSPEEELKKATDFIGKGNPKEALKVINPSLKRSKHIKGNPKGLKKLIKQYKAV